MFKFGKPFPCFLISYTSSIPCYLYSTWQAARREKKELIDKEKGRTNKKLLENLLRSHAIKTVLGNENTTIEIPRKMLPEPDIFQLPPLHEIDRE